MKHIIKTTWGGCARPISAHAKRDVELSHFIHAEYELSRHIYSAPKIFRRLAEAAGLSVSQLVRVLLQVGKFPIFGQKMVGKLL